MVETLLIKQKLLKPKRWANNRLDLLASNSVYW